jgi:hypothetical protein
MLLAVSMSYAMEEGGNSRSVKRKILSPEEKLLATHSTPMNFVVTEDCSEALVGMGNNLDALEKVLQDEKETLSDSIKSGLLDGYEEHAVLVSLDATNKQLMAGFMKKKQIQSLAHAFNAKFDKKKGECLLFAEQYTHLKGFIGSKPQDDKNKKKLALKRLQETADVLSTFVGDDPIKIAAHEELLKKIHVLSVEENNNPKSEI